MPVRVPPLPSTIGLTDRDTGKVWYLKVDTGQLDPAGAPRLALVDTILGWDKIAAQVFGPYDGPWLSNNTRIFVRNAHLGFEVLNGYNNTDAGVIARTLANELIWYQLRTPATIPFPTRLNLAYVQVHP